MSRIQKRKQYATSSDDDYSPESVETPLKSNKVNRNYGRRQRCFNKSALIARENRIKKKKYIEDLEETVDKLRKDNGRLASILDNQSQLIKRLKCYQKYLQGLMRNQTDICKLLKVINGGLKAPPQSPKIHQDHPWLDENIAQNEYLLMDEASDLNLFDNALLCFNEEVSTTTTTTITTTLFPNDDDKDSLISSGNLDEHNYTANCKSGLDDDGDNPAEDGAGICIHVSKSRIALEFCPLCSEAAGKQWKQT